MNSLVTLVRIAKENNQPCPFRKQSAYGSFCSYAHWLRRKLDHATPVSSDCIHDYKTPDQWLNCPHMKRFLVRNPLSQKPEPPRHLHPFQRRQKTWRQRVTPWRDY